MTKKILTICCLSLLMANTSQAGSVWQQIDNSPCPGMVIIDDTGDNNDGYVLPPTDNYDDTYKQKEVIDTYTQEDEELDNESDDIYQADQEPATNSTPYD